MVLDHDFPPDLRVENEARSLLEVGYDVTVWAIGPDERPAVEMHAGMRVLRDRIPAQLRNKLRGLSGLLPFLDWYLLVRLRSIMKRYPFDVIHAHDLYLFGPCLRAGGMLGVPVVGDMHENWVEALRHYNWSTRPPGKWFVSYSRWEKLELQWAASVDGLIVVIEEMAKRLRSAGLQRSDIAVVPNTVHLDTFGDWLDRSLEDAPATRGDGPVLLYTGGMDRHRGLESVIDAMPAILDEEPETTLLLVGDGATRRELERRVEQLGLGRSVRFEGWRPQEEIGAYMAGADVGLIPHLKNAHTDNTIPHKLFHYMLAGLPVVASNCEPIERILAESGAGLTAESGRSASFSDAVLQIVSRPDRGRAMGTAGRDAVFDRYHWDATVQPLIDLYHSLLSVPRKTPNQPRTDAM